VTPAPTPSPTPIPSSVASSGTGISAESLSTALPVQARDLRLVRVGANEIALQFEFANKADRPVTPDTLGIDQYRRVLMLVDLPRSTAYETSPRGATTAGSARATGHRYPPVGRSR
jgi:hypothetical protein